MSAESGSDRARARRGDHAVAHPAGIIAYTTDYLAHVLYPFGVKVSAWEHDLPKLVKEGWTR